MLLKESINLKPVSYSVDYRIRNCILPLSDGFGEMLYESWSDYNNKDEKEIWQKLAGFVIRHLVAEKFQI